MKRSPVHIMHNEGPSLPKGRWHKTNAYIVQHWGSDTYALELVLASATINSQILAKISILKIIKKAKKLFVYLGHFWFASTWVKLILER